MAGRSSLGALVTLTVLLGGLAEMGDRSLHAAELGAGDPAPDFEAIGVDGKPLKLSSFRGKKNVVLVFSRAHW